MKLLFLPPHFDQVFGGAVPELPENALLLGRTIRLDQVSIDIRIYILRGMQVVQ
jgi:hypothetical protein